MTYLKKHKLLASALILGGMLNSAGSGTANAAGSDVWSLQRVDHFNNFYDASNRGIGKRVKIRQPAASNRAQLRDCHSVINYDDRGETPRTYITYNCR